MDKSKGRASEGRTGSGIRNDVAGITWSPFKADVGDTIAMDFQSLGARGDALTWYIASTL